MMAVTGLNRPDFRTISDFRKRHLPALQQLFVQVLRLCQAAGLVKLGHVAVDGTKLRANASKHKAMSYKHMASQEPKLAAEVASWLDQADAADAAEDAQHGAGQRGDETPGLDGRQAAPPRTHPCGQGAAGGRGQGRTPGVRSRWTRPVLRHAGAWRPQGQARRHAARQGAAQLHRPDSRIMPSQGGFIAGYNGQIAVDAAHQIIVAQQLSTNPADFAALVPLVDQARANLGRKLREVSGDTGFATEANLDAMAERRGCGLPVAGSHQAWRHRPYGRPAC